MLWVLHLCADAGIVVTSYTDDARGEMAEHPDGSGEFTSVTLHPKMTITDGSRIPDALIIHDEAHRVCCLARSVNFRVMHEPNVLVSPAKEPSVPTMKSDLEIAQAATPIPIDKIAAQAGILPDELELYGANQSEGAPLDRESSERRSER